MIMLLKKKTNLPSTVTQLNKKKNPKKLNVEQGLKVPAAIEIKLLFLKYIFIKVP